MCNYISMIILKGINMIEISSKERLVLLALEKCQAEMTEMRLVTVTGLPIEEVQESVVSLVKLGRARQVLDGPEATSEFTCKPVRPRQILSESNAAPEPFLKRKWS
ncbi:MAG: hypothetical protein ABSG51_15245 [Terracidiphilus sp.]